MCSVHEYLVRKSSEGQIKQLWEYICVVYLHEKMLLLATINTHIPLQIQYCWMYTISSVPDSSVGGWGGCYEVTGLWYITSTTKKTRIWKRHMWLVTVGTLWNKKYHKHEKKAAVEPSDTLIRYCWTFTCMTYTHICAYMHMYNIFYKHS